MRKKCIAIAKKAMVWALAASMLVATPLTASAAGLRDVYKVEDGWGETVGEPDEKDTRTGTVSATGSNTGVLNNESKILGISLNKTNIKMEMDGSYDPAKTVTEKLEVSLIFASGVKKEDQAKITEQLKSSFRWETSDRDIVTVTAKENGQVKDNPNTNVVALNAKAGGSATVTVSLDRDYLGEDIHFKAAANVSIKQYADLVEPNPAESTQFIGHTLKIKDAFIVTPDTANEAIVYDIKEQNPAGVATLKNGVLTFKKAGSVEVFAVTEKGDKTPATITVSEGNPAKSIAFRKRGETNTKKKDDLNANKEDKYELEAVLTPKYPEDETHRACNDTVVSWTAKKAGIVDVEKVDGTHATLTPVKAGSTQITAVTTNGKKGTFTINVKATLTGLQIVTKNTTLWSGQTLQLEVNKQYGNAKDNIGNDKLKWYIVNKNDVEKFAKINATTGLLTIQPTVGETKIIEVAVQSAKKIDGGYVQSKEPESIQIGMKQANVAKIVVSENNESDPLANAGYPGKAVKKTVKIAAGKNKTYNVVAYDENNKTTVDGTEDGTPLAATLNWTSAKTKIATVSRVGASAGKVTTDKDGKGKSTITVSGATKKGNTYKALKATFTVDVTRPTSTITLTTKTNAIKAASDVSKRKAQSVSFSAKLDAKTTSKTSAIEWNVEQKDANGNSKSCVATIKKGKVSIPRKSDGYAPGDQFVVTATLKDADDKSSVTATATVNVVSESYAVVIQDEKLATPAPFNKNKTVLSIGDSQLIGVMVDIGAKNSPNLQKPNYKDLEKGKVAADVALSVNKAGIVQIKDNNNGTYSVYRIKKGAVKITATTSDGKKTTLTVN